MADCIVWYQVSVGLANALQYCLVWVISVTDSAVAWLQIESLQVTTLQFC